MIGRALMAFALLFASGCADAPSPPGLCQAGASVGITVGQCAPDFVLPDADGALTSLSSFRGQVAVVDIAALW